MIWDSEADDGLLGSLFPREMTSAINTMNFQDTTVNGLSNEISNHHTLNSPFGTESLFYAKNGQLINSEIEMQQLMEIIKRLTEKKNILKYISRDYQRVYPNSTREFIFQNKTITIDAKINTLDGEIDFACDPYFRFAINIKEQTTSYSLCYPFRAYSDSKDENKMAIILNISNGNDFNAVLSFLGKSLKEVSQKEILDAYNNAFKAAGTNTEILDFIYENVPDFVLKQRPDALLYNDLKLLSEKIIDKWGINENIAILNIINNIKNIKWFYEETNKNPELVRNLFRNFSSSYVDQLIVSLGSIGLKNWKREQLEKAWNFEIEFIEFSKNSDAKPRDPYTTYTGFAYYNDNKKKYKIGTKIFGYKDRMSISPEKTREFGPEELVDAYVPMKIVVGETVAYIPVFAAEYFTNEKIDNEKSNILNNAVAGLLPELTALRGSTLLQLSNLFKGKKITTVEELIEFLDKVDESILATDLDKVGIEALFRGTTRNSEDVLFSGNANSIANGASTSTDPIRAVIFGIESSSKPGTKGVLQVYAPKDLKGLNLQVPNHRVSKELEIIINTSPENLSKFVIKEIPIEDARKLIEEVYTIILDTRIDPKSGRALELLKETKKLTPKESLEFYRKVIKLKK